MTNKKKLTDAQMADLARDYVQSRLHDYFTAELQASGSSVSAYKLHKKDVIGVQDRLLDWAKGMGFPAAIVDKYLNPMQIFNSVWSELDNQISASSND